MGGAIVIPTGTVTFLFTDIEGSTKLAQQYPDEMPALLARHNEILNQSIKLHSGFVFQIVGDSFSAAFHSARVDSRVISIGLVLITRESARA